MCCRLSIQKRALSTKSYEEPKKEPATSYSRTGESRTTLGDGALDFRVRNGNGYDSSSMVTGKKPEDLGTKGNYSPIRDADGDLTSSEAVKKSNKLSRTSY